MFAFDSGSRCAQQPRPARREGDIRRAQPNWPRPNAPSRTREVNRRTRLQHEHPYTLILVLASEVKLEVFVVILELAESTESITVETETVREAIKFAKESRLTIPTKVDCSAVKADIEGVLSINVVEHTWFRRNGRSSTINEECYEAFCVADLNGGEKKA